ncbi:MAG: hypothetical protein LLG04_07290 [Parachlamydia sp.]|nr:hypothetical protein [Parachlamydia sp.]
MAIRKMTREEKAVAKELEQQLKREGLGVIGPSRESYNRYDNEFVEKEPDDWPNSFLDQYVNIFHSYTSWEAPWHEQLMYAYICDGKLPKDLTEMFKMREKALWLIINRYMKRMKKLL